MNLQTRQLLEEIDQMYEKHILSILNQYKNVNLNNPITIKETKFLI